MVRTILPFALGVSLVAGCVPSRSAAFAPVAREAGDRTGYEVTWRSPAMEDAAVAATVREMLAEGLTQDDAIRIALLNNKHLQAAFEEIGIGWAELARASVPRNPTVHAEMHFTRHGTPGLELALLQDVVDLIDLRRRRGAAAADLETARAAVVGSVVDLVAEVRLAYFAAQADEQRLELRETVHAAAEASHLLAQRLHDAGNITDLDLLRERAMLSQAMLDLEDARQVRTESRERLSALLGLWGEDISWTIRARLPDLPADEDALEDLEHRAVAASVDLSGHSWRMRAAGARTSSARLRRWLPGLSLGVSAEREHDGVWGVGPKAVLVLPLWDRNTGAIARGEAELRQAQQSYGADAVDTRAAARAARQRLVIARDRAGRIRDEILPLRARIVDEMLRAYNAMDASTFELIAARQQQIDAGVAYVDAVYEYWAARAAIDQLLAGRTPSAPERRTSAAPTEPAPSHPGGN